MSCDDCKGVPEAVCITPSQFQELLDAIATGGGAWIPPDVTPRIENFSGNAEETLSGFPAGSMGRIVSVGENGGGEIYITVDATLPSSTNGFVARSDAICFCDLNNVPLDDVRMLGSVAGASYFIAYEVYN